MPPCEQYEGDHRHYRKPWHESPDLGEFCAERTNLDFETAGHTSGEGTDRGLDGCRQAKRLVPPFGSVQLIDEADGVFGDENPHSLQRRSEPAPVERPDGKQNRRDDPVDHENRQAARQWPPVSRQR
jgi:hypothetical protein